MRRALLPLLALPLLSLCASCSVDGTAVYADVRWWAVCPNDMSWQGCQNGVRHDFQQFDGDVIGPDLYRASCFAVTVNGQLSVSFSVQEGDDLIDVRGLVTGLNGGPAVGSACSVQITETDNSFGGRCGAAAPSPTQPCQVLDVAVDRDDPDGKSITVRMSCDKLPWDAMPSLGYNLRDTASTSSPAELRLANCRGL